MADDIPVFRKPAQGPTTSSFGPREDHFHQGMDIGASRGSEIGSAADGVVRYSGVQQGYGNMVIVEHPDGWTTTYAHMDGPSPVAVGTPVKAGDVIGKVGNTGTSRGPGGGYHLHWETRKNGAAYDPSLFIDGRLGTLPPAASGKAVQPVAGASPSTPSDKIENRQQTDVLINDSWAFYQAYDKDDTPKEFKETPFIHPPQPYYAAAELKFGDDVVCPLAPMGRSLEIMDPGSQPEYQSTRGLDLRLMEFQHRDIAQGGATSLFRLFLKAWADVVKLADICAVSNIAQYRFGYTNFRGSSDDAMPGMRNWQDAIVVDFQPEFLENGYYVSLELHDTGSFGSNQIGAKTFTWRVIGGRISDLVIHLCNLNGWKCCVEPTIPNKEHITYPQVNKTDLNFIVHDLARNARSEIPRPWIEEGSGQSSYRAFFVNNVLHFHPMCPDPMSPGARSNRFYVWGGVHNAATRVLGTVLSFKPDFKPGIFQVIGGSRIRNRSTNPVTKEINTVEASGSDIKDSIMGSGKSQVVHKMSSETIARSASSPHHEIDLVRNQLANRFFMMRDLAFAGSLTIIGDPWVHTAMLINVMTVRPVDGVLMYYDWFITETIHDIVNGEYKTSMQLLRYHMGIRPEDDKLPGRGVGMGLQESMTVSADVTSFKVGQTFESLFQKNP